MKTLKPACTPRASTFDPTRRDTVLDLSDLIDNRIDPADFFAENHITEGMKTLLSRTRPGRQSLRTCSSRARVRSVDVFRTSAHV